MAAFWVWAFSPWKPDSLVDRLDSDGFATVALPRCEQMLAELDALPNAQTIESPQERADLVVSGNAVISSMVTDLRSMASGGPADRALLDAWFADWDRYLADRDRHVDRLRSAELDDDLRFRLTALPGGRGVDVRIDGFALINHIEACSTPGDV